MGRRVFGLAAFAAIALASSAACTLLVDNSFKGYGDQCTLPNANATHCGQCIEHYCGQQVTDNCNDPNNQIVSSLNECAGDPSPSNGGGSRCNAFLDDASVNAIGQSGSQIALRRCVQGSCTKDCLECTDVDAGASPCGQCIVASCKDTYLSGVNGCCDDSTVQSWITACTDPNAATCADLLVSAAEHDGGVTDIGSYCNPHNFAVCVHDNCVTAGKCPSH